MTSVHQGGKNLVRQASQPLVIHLMVVLLRLPLLQEPVSVLIDGLHDISKNHWAFHSRGDFCTTMQNTMVVHHYHGMLWPIKLALESVLLQQSHPSLVSIHVRFIDLKWKSRDTTFCLRLNNLGQMAIFIKAQNGMSMCQLKCVASGVGLSIVSTILGINTSHSDRKVKCTNIWHIHQRSRYQKNEQKNIATKHGMISGFILLSYGETYHSF